MKPNCYECKFRRDIPGDAHSSCDHPLLAGIAGDPLGQIFGILGSGGRTLPSDLKLPGMKVRGNPHGIRNGWFNHPFNFDPVWLEECSGFTSKKEEGDEIEHNRKEVLP